MVGITTVFTSDGLYCVSNLSQAVPYGDYEAEVLASLRRTIQHLARTMNWQEREHVRLIFHAFKPLRRGEEDAVKELMKSLGSYGWGLAASIVSLIPIATGCICTGMPFGLWGLIVLLNADVKAGFAAARGVPEGS